MSSMSSNLLGVKYHTALVAWGYIVSSSLWSSLLSIFSSSLFKKYVLSKTKLHW